MEKRIDNMEEIKKSINYFPDWKMKDKKYLTELQRFLDKADNIKDENLKNDIIKQMLNCDKALTKLVQDKIG